MSATTRDVSRMCMAARGRHVLLPSLMTIVLLVAGSVFLRSTAIAEDLRIAADNQLYYAHDAHHENEAFRDLMEDWAAVTIGYGDIEGNLVYEAHLPPPSWSPDTIGQGIYERWITFKRDHFSATLGTFYTQLGKGLTLTSVRNRELRYSSNIDGAQFAYRNRYLDLTALGGRMRDLAGRRMGPLQATDIRVTPLSWAFLGGTYVQTKLFDDPRTSRIGSAYFQIQNDYGSLYTEVASRDPGSGSGAAARRGILQGTGTAMYSTLHLFVRNVSAMAEVASYDSFDISRGVQMYNSPPPAFKEHSNALMARALPSLLANNHTAIHTHVTYAVTDESNLSLDLSRARAVRDDRGERRGVTSLVRCADFLDSECDYSDVFAKGEFVFPSAIDWILGSGYQKTVSGSYLNFVVNGDWGVMENHSVQGVFEHQLATAAFGRKYFNQIYSFTIARAAAPRLALSGTVEYTSDQTSERHVWLGTQVNWTFFGNNDLVVFVGKRKKGKICAGGICVVKPEFSGIEVTITSRW